MSRYQRQSRLPEIGEAGQAKLAAARVLVVGAGGLGVPVLNGLAGAGVGHLTLVDHDKVEESNLHRQPLYRMGDIGKPKVIAARDALLSYNPQISIEAVQEKLDPANADTLVAKADLVVDAADSFAVTYVLSDACRIAEKYLVSASALGLEGYAGIFCGKGPSYRAVFPDMPAQARNCAEAGVLGTVVAVLGSLQAHLCLHSLLQLEAIQPRLTTFDGRTLRFGTFDYSHAAEPLQTLPFITPAQIRADDIIVDVRGRDEAPHSTFPHALRLLPDEIDSALPKIEAAGRAVICCRSGLRASRAARRLQALGVKNLALLALGDG